MILDGRKVSGKIITRVRDEVSKLDRCPKVIDILVGDDSSSLVYVKRIEKVCNEVGIDFKFCYFNSNVLEDEIVSCINKFNNDKSVDAIMIHFPLPEGFNTKRIINSISSNKDVDCITDYNRRNSDIIPSTPKAILKILDYYDISLNNKKIVIVGRGFLVGRPLKKVLEEKGYNVLVCHSKTKDLSLITRNADILICATPTANLITANMVNSNCTIIDVGSSYINGKVYGNVCWDVYTRVKNIAPIIGGVGPVTVASFLENILICYYKNR